MENSTTDYQAYHENVLGSNGVSFLRKSESESESRSVISNSLRPHGL